MKNVNLTVNGNVLTITVDLSQNQGKSASGKNTIIASTGGNIEIPNGNGAKLGLNIYRKD